MRILAVDWSGKAKGAEESMWVAEIRDGTLVDLRSGLGRGAVIDRLIAAAAEDHETVAGLDFAFSFPGWWCTRRGWHDARDVWTAMRSEGEHLLEACEPPFWGRPGKPNPNPGMTGLRRTELQDGRGAKSVFQIGGAGAVGTGSIRGMPYLATLAASGFRVWPFHAAGWPRVLEIYPRALTGRVIKSSWSARHAHLQREFPDQPATLLERAASSEDAFDAAVSALVMDRHRAVLAGLEPTGDPVLAIEGRIWCPT